MAGEGEEEKGGRLRVMGKGGEAREGGGVGVGGQGRVRVPGRGGARCWLRRLGGGGGA